MRSSATSTSAPWVAVRSALVVLVTLVLAPAGILRADEPVPAIEAPPTAGATLPLPAPDRSSARIIWRRAGADGVEQWVVQPEFRGVPALLQDLRALGLEGMRYEPMGPVVALPPPSRRAKTPPPQPTRVLLEGKPEAVADAFAHLRRLDVPPWNVAVSLLIAEVTYRKDRARGAEFLYDKAATMTPGETLFRSAQTNFLPDSYLQSTLTGFRPFEGTSYRFRDPNTLGGAWEYTLRMLLKEGEANVHAWPNLLLQQGVPGLIEAVENIPRYEMGGLANRPVVRRIQSDAIGLRMRVTPRHVGPAGAELDLDLWMRMPEILGSQDTFPGGIVLRERKFTTRLTARDREPLVMGGLFMRRASNLRKGLPLAKALPALDLAGGAHDARCVDTELVILVHMRVIDPRTARIPSGPAASCCR